MSPLPCTFEQAYSASSPPNRVSMYRPSSTTRFYFDNSVEKKKFNLTINLTKNEPRLVILSNKKVFNHLANHKVNKYKLNNIEYSYRCQNVTSEYCSGPIAQSAPPNTTQYLIDDYQQRQQANAQNPINDDFANDWNMTLLNAK
jgi:hypothetical protein